MLNLAGDEIKISVFANQVAISHTIDKSRRVSNGKKKHLSTENEAIKKCSELALKGKTA